MSRSLVDLESFDIQWYVRHVLFQRGQVHVDTHQDHAHVSLADDDEADPECVDDDDDHSSFSSYYLLI